MAYPSGLGIPAAMAQFLRRPTAAPVGAVARTGPSNADVLKAVYGSVAKGQAAQAASIAEARQRESEQIAQDHIPRGRPAPPEPPMLSPRDMELDVPDEPALVTVEEEESDGEVIEEIAEGDEEGDYAFAGWNIGMGERPVGVAFTRREVARMGDIRRRQQRQKVRGLSALATKIAAPVLPPPQPGRRFGTLPKKFIPKIKVPKPGVNIWRT